MKIRDKFTVKYANSPDAETVVSAIANLLIETNSVDILAGLAICSNCNSNNTNIFENVKLDEIIGEGVR